MAGRRPLGATAQAALVLLTFGAASGYELKQRADNTLRFFFAAPAMSQLYAELARLAEREGRRPSPIYQAHKWFARRFSSAFRALVVAARLPAEGDFGEAYYEGVDYRGLTVLDPFVGGGTSVVEASLLGANTVGIDIDAVACAITNFEIGHFKQTEHYTATNPSPLPTLSINEIATEDSSTPSQLAGTKRPRDDADSSNVSTPRKRLPVGVVF